MNAVTMPSTRLDNRFFLGAGIATMALVLWGFAHTYYLKVLFHSPVLPFRLHLHGAVMTLWVVMFFAQTCLISAHRVDIHKRLGMFGVLIAVGVVILGTTTTVHAAAREVNAHSSEAVGRVVVLGVELIQMLLFAGFVGTAIWWRKRRDTHKRLMLLATACLLPSPIGRLWFVQSNLTILFLFDAAVVAFVLADTLVKRRLHPAFVWGSLVLLASLNLGYAGSITPEWRAFGTRLVSEDPVTASSAQPLELIPVALHLSTKVKYE
jgi:hypothetical protein